MTGVTRRRRWNWRKLASYMILVYLAVWFSHSVVEYLTLRHEEAAVSSQISQARLRNQSLSHDLSDLRNPAYVKQMLLGKAITPRPNLNGISAAERPS